jgi:hypothetical protein
MVPFSAPVGPFGAKIAAGSPKQGRQGQRSEPAVAPIEIGARNPENSFKTKSHWGLAAFGRLARLDS